MRGRFYNLFLIVLLVLILARFPPHTLRGGTVATLLLLTHTNQTLVDSGIDAVVLLDVDFWNHVLLYGTSFTEIPHRRHVDNISHDKSLYGFVLGDKFA